MHILDDHRVLPGRQVGDIGRSYDMTVQRRLTDALYAGIKALGAWSTTDNGYARLDHVRIPAKHMLSKFAHVTEDGQYVQPPHAKISYGGVSNLHYSLRL